MSREIEIDDERKIKVYQKNDKYFALQEKDIMCSHFTTKDKFSSREEAIKRLKEFNPMENNNRWKINNGLQYRIVYIEEIEDYTLNYQKKGGFPINGIRKGRK